MTATRKTRNNCKRITIVCDVPAGISTWSLTAYLVESLETWRDVAPHALTNVEVTSITGAYRAKD